MSCDNYLKGGDRLEIAIAVKYLYHSTFLVIITEISYDVRAMDKICTDFSP